MSNVQAEQVLQTANTAFRLFQNGWKNGDFAEFVAIITDDFEFSFPTGEHRGIFTGKAGHEKMLAKCRDDSASAPRLTIHNPRTTAVDGQTVIFEFESKGDFGGIKYHGRNLIALVVNNEKISGFREYFGDLDPQLFAK